MQSTFLGHRFGFSAALVLTALGLAWLVTSPRTAAAALPEPDVRRDAVVEAVQRVMPSVVNIATEEVVRTRDPLESLFRDFFDPYYRRRAPNTQYSLGSGVIIDEEGFVLTNFHVVNRASRVWVKLHDGREYECEKISGNSRTDVALLRLRGKPGERFTAVKFAADDDLLLGETVLALGNPFGLGASVSRGILSSKSRRPTAESESLDVPDWLQTDAAINPGNSGGPLVNLRGELIGVSVAVLSQGQGIGFAIPVKLVAAMMAEIYSPELLDSLWFGARVRPGTRPLVVSVVQEESPASKAGLRAGDLVLEVNGRAPAGFVDFTRAVTATKDQRDVTLAISRGGQRKTLTVRLVPEKSYFNSELIRRKIGTSVQELTSDLSRAMGVPAVQGVLISGVDSETPAAAARLDAGMIVTHIDGQATPDVVAAAKILHAKATGARIRLDLIISSRRGAFVRLAEATAEVTVR